MDPSWVVSLLIGLIGVIVGAYSNRLLADRSERKKQIRQTYVAWIEAVQRFRDSSTTGTPNAEYWPARGAAFAAQWMVDLVEADPERRQAVKDINTAAAQGDWDKVFQKIDAFVADLRREFLADG